MRYAFFRQMLAILCIVGACLSSGWAEPILDEQGSHQVGWHGPFKLGAGDVLNVFIWKHKELSTPVTVRPDGMISYPLIGEIKAAGLTVKEIEDKLASLLKQHIQDPQVTVILEAAHSFRIYVLGEVMQPGVFQIKGPVTVLQAIAMAGGFTTFASRNKIFIYNPNTEGEDRLPFNYSSFVSGQDSHQNIVLRPGDTVIVP